MARAEKSGRRLSLADASIVKGMVKREDRHHDIAAWFGVNQGRIAEVISGDLHPTAPVASAHELPPKGPYSSGQAVATAKAALSEAQKLITQANKENGTKLLEAALLQLEKALKAI